MKKAISLFGICIQSMRIRLSWAKWCTACRRFKHLVAFANKAVTVMQHFQIQRHFKWWAFVAHIPLPGYEHVTYASRQVREMRRRRSLHHTLMSFRACVRYRRVLQRHLFARWRTVVNRRTYMRRWAAGGILGRASGHSSHKVNAWPQLTWVDRTQLKRMVSWWRSKVCRRRAVACVIRSRRHSCLRLVWSGWEALTRARKNAMRFACEYVVVSITVFLVVLRHLVQRNRSEFLFVAFHFLFLQLHVDLKRKTGTQSAVALASTAYQSRPRPLAPCHQVPIVSKALRWLAPATPSTNATNF